MGPEGSKPDLDDTARQVTRTGQYWTDLGHREEGPGVCATCRRTALRQSRCWADSVVEET